MSVATKSRPADGRTAPPEKGRSPARRRDDAEAGADGDLRIRLFDADRRDRKLSFDDALRVKPSARQLLWIDVSGDLPRARHRELTRRFGLDEATERALQGTADQPHVALYGQSFHVRAAAEPDPARPKDRRWLDVVAAPNVVITHHSEPLAFLDAIDERIAADATIGELDSAEFVATLLDAVVTSYLAAVDAIENELDELDSKALRRESFDSLFPDLVRMRHRIGRLRRTLAAHRELFAAVGRPDFGRATAAADPDALQAVKSRFEAAVAAVEAAREMVLGSFDVLMTRTAQRTNDVMRILTVATVLALPASVLAGFLGMNVVTPLPADDPAAFWIAVVIVVAIQAAMLALARARGWL